MTARLVALVCLTGLLCACPAVGPDYKRPELNPPERFSEAGADTTAKGEASSRAGAWWLDFHDRTLNDLMDQAARGNLDLAQARARIVQARASLRQSTASLFPSVTSSGALTRTYNTVDAQAPSATGSTESWTNVYKAGFDASWELDLFGGLRRTRQASQAEYEASREAARDTLVTLQGDVAANYVALRSAQERLALSRKNVADLADLAQITSTRHRAGLVSYLDVAQAQAKLAAAQAGMPALETEAKQAAHRLGVLLGREPAALKDRLLREATLPEFSGPVAPGLPSQLLERRPDLRQAERTLAASSASIGVSVAKLYPTFDLTGGLGLQNGDFAKFMSFTPWFASLAPSVTLPLFSAGKTRAEITGKRAAFDENLAKYRAAWLTALEDVENALAAYYGELENRRRLSATVAAYEENLAVAMERYTRGLTTFLDVLDARQSLHTASMSLAASRAALLTDLVSLSKALGGGWMTGQAEETPEVAQKGRPPRDEHQRKTNTHTD